MATRRLISFICALLFCVALMSACGESGQGSESGSDVNTEFSKNDVVYVNADGESTYQVIRSINSSDAEGTAASKVFKTLKEKYGVSPKNTTDSDSDGVGVPEILVGKTAREQSGKAREWLSAKGSGRAVEYIIATIDEDIVIYGLSDEGLAAAVDYFCEHYLTGDSITGGIEYSYLAKDSYTDYPICGNTVLSKFRIVRPIYNVSYLTQTETDKLVASVLSKTGYVIDIVNDNIASNTGNNTDGSGTLTPTEAAEYEIIIGNAERDGVKKIEGYSTYEIRIEDKKVYLNGGSAHATAMAVSEFIRLFESSSGLSAENSILNGDYDAVIGNYDTATTYRPKWGDYFDGTVIDETIWDIRWDEVTSYGKAADGKAAVRGSKKLNNNYVENGCLYLNAVSDETTYYGGMIDTKEKMYYLYGYVEISTIHPKGDGFWTALWGGSTPDYTPEFADTYYTSETDIEECYGDGTWAYGNTFAWPTRLGRLELEIPAGTQGTVHVNNRISSADDRGFWMDFHTFGFEWLDKTHVRFTCDGYAYVDQQLREGAEQIAYEQPQFLIISLAHGGQSKVPTKDPKETTESNKYIVDWVHVYQKDGQVLYGFDENAKQIYALN